MSEPVPLRAFLGYFVRLGTFGFAGPISLAGYMQRDLVEQRGWLTEVPRPRAPSLAQCSSAADAPSWMCRRC